MVPPVGPFEANIVTGDKLVFPIDELIVSISTAKFSEVIFHYLGTNIAFRRVPQCFLQAP